MSVDEITLGTMSEDEMSVDDMSVDKRTELVNFGQDAFICHVCKWNYSRLDACREGVCRWNDCQ